jgi:hypothetical protein
MVKFVRVTDDVISRLLQDKVLRNTFEFLSQPPRVKPPAKRCGGCGRRAVAKPPIDTNTIRKRLTQIPPDKLAIVKRVLATAELRIRFRDHKGKIVDRVV